MPVSEQRRLTTIMFTDMVGYSALTQKNEALALALLDEQRAILRELFVRHGGREIEAVGDGFFVEFPSALAGARCAVDIQQTLSDRNAAAPPERPIRVRIGLHLGDVVSRDERVHGDGVNIAARIEPLAEPGGICLSEDVARQIQNKIDFPLRKLGKGELKNIQTPVEIYRVVLPGERRHLPLMERLAFSLRRKRTRRIGVASVVLLALLVVAGLYLWQDTAHRASARAKPRVAVLPFANLSREPDTEYFADGVTEELISKLSRLSGLDVIARTSVMKYKGATKDIAEVGRELNVGAVLEGSVRKAGTQVRITVQLIKVANQAHLWAEDYDRELRDVLTVQTEVARHVAEALKVRLLGGERQRVESRGTDDPDAYNLYLLARFHWNKRTKDGLQKAIEYFEQAAQKDPQYALAYAGAADAHVLLAAYDYARPREAYPRAKALATKALKLDNTLPEAHAAAGLAKAFFEWDWTGAQEELRGVVSLYPSNARGRFVHGDTLSWVGKYQEAITETQRALELDPLSLVTNAHLGLFLARAGRYDQAIEQLTKTLAMDPNFFLAHYLLGMTYLWKGLHEEAIAEFRKAVELTGNDPETAGRLAWAYAAAGKPAEAWAIINALKQRAKREYVPADAYPWAYASLGERDLAIEWLEKMVEERSADLYFLRDDPTFDSLRSVPRFRAILTKINLDK